MAPAPSLRSLLAGYVARSPEEAADLAAVELLADDPSSAFDRRTPLHVTGSALVVHPPTQRVLLRWHERQQAWLQVGGHGDADERDPAAIAIREAVEETGLADVHPWPATEPELLHLVIVPVPAKGDEPAHQHADVRIILATDRPGDIVAESDAAPLRWLTLAEAHDLTGEENLRESLRRVGERLGG